MPLPQSASAFAFTTAILFAGVCWFVGVAEAIGIWRFWAWAYRAGPRIVTRTVPRPSSAFQSGVVLGSSDVKAKGVSSQQILFRAPMPPFTFRISTPFPILGTATLEMDGLRVIGRIPIGPTGFFACWLLAWTAGGVTLGDSKPLAGLGLVALGWAFAAGLGAFSISLELGRFRRAQDALLAQLAGTAA